METGLNGADVLKYPRICRKIFTIFGRVTHMRNLEYETATHESEAHPSGGDMCVLYKHNTEAVTKTRNVG